MEECLVATDIDIQYGDQFDCQCEIRILDVQKNSKKYDIRNNNIIIKITMLSTIAGIRTHNP